MNIYRIADTFEVETKSANANIQSISAHPAQAFSLLWRHQEFFFMNQMIGALRNGPLNEGIYCRHLALLTMNL